ncbi:MAG: alpha-E domain-containing protein [Sulfuricaulis sp.]|uniref:alpha-E domain-containing protein n=1 Tax=Sulfuricaulis sp. TaxID=2003553 RepID=UPI003C6A2C5B
MMLSRVAENLYWMARYLERAENSARLINVNTNLLLDLPKRVQPGWAPLIEISGNLSAFREQYADTDERSVVKYLIGDTNHPGSILSSLGSARENARTVRDFIPRETWEQVNELYLYAKGNLASGLGHRRRYEYLRGIILGVQQITGLLAGTMTHDEGYDMLRMGRNLERADMTIRIIDVRTVNLLPEMSKELTPFENIQWMSVLKSLSAYQMYRRAMQVRVSRPDVLRFLFKERLFPRAFYHTVSEVEFCLRHLPRRELPLRCVSDLKERVTAAHPENFDQAELHEFIDTLEIGLIDLNRAISDTYFLANISSA